MLRTDSNSAVNRDSGRGEPYECEVGAYQYVFLEFETRARKLLRIAGLIFITSKKKKNKTAFKRSYV